MEAERVPGRGDASASATRTSSASTSSRSGPSGRSTTCPGATRPPIPELRGSPQKQARRRDVWRSVITQQLQADELAVEMATQLFSMAPHARREALLHDDGAGRGAPHRGVAAADRARGRPRRARPVPRQDGAARHRRGHARGEGLPDAGLLRAADHPEVQGDREVVARHRAREPLQPASRSTTASITEPASPTSGCCSRVASKKTKGKLVKAANTLLPIFVEHELWRPRERAWIGDAMRSADIARLRSEVDHGVRLARSLGVDVGDVQLPF